MLTIRQQQIDALSRDMRKRFEQRMMGHVQQFFPQRCQALEGSGVQDWIRHGIERAAYYHIESEIDVCRYIDVMFTFGLNFDVDPNLRWAARILNAKPTSASVRVNHLVAAAKKEVSTGPIYG